MANVSALEWSKKLAWLSLDASCLSLHSERSPLACEVSSSSVVAAILLGGSHACGTLLIAAYKLPIRVPEHLSPRALLQLMAIDKKNKQGRKEVCASGVFCGQLFALFN